MTDIELAWASGLFEGEGTVRINKPTKRNWGTLVVSVVNTDRQICDWFQARWPGYMKAATGLRANQRAAWLWVTAARKAVVFLSAIAPFVVRDAVREKIRVGLEFQAGKRIGIGSRGDAYLEEQWNAYWWMCVLNQRGVSPCPEAARFRKTKEPKP